MKENGYNESAQSFVPRLFCRICSSPLVQASDWRIGEGSLWHVRLWCPECGFEQTALVDWPQSTYLSLAIEEGFAQMLEALEQMTTRQPAVSSLDLVRRAQTERIEPSS